MFRAFEGIVIHPSSLTEIRERLCDKNPVNCGKNPAAYAINTREAVRPRVGIKIIITSMRKERETADSINKHTLLNIT